MATTIEEARFQVEELKKAHAKTIEETKRTPRIYQMYRGRKPLGSFGIRFELTPATPVVEDAGTAIRFVLEE